MAALRLTVPDSVDVAELTEEVVTGLGDRLRDEYGYELDTGRATTPTTRTTVYALRPEGSIVVTADGALTVSLRRLDVDARDLFTGLISALEQRHDGIRAEIR